MIASSQYRRLLEEIHQLTYIPKSLLSCNLIHLSVRGVDFSMYLVGGHDDEHVIISCDLGSLPKKRREEVLLRLLDTNFHLLNSAKPITFCRNEHSRNMMLSIAQRLSPNLSGQSTLDLMGSLVDYVLIWRQTYFLDQMPSNSQAYSAARPPHTFGTRKAF